MTIYSRQGGSWKAATPYVHHSGSWKTPKEVFVRRNGSWVSVWEDIKEIRYTATAQDDGKGNWSVTFLTRTAGQSMAPFISGSVSSGRKFVITAAEGTPNQTSAIYAGGLWMHELNTSDNSIADNNFKNNHPLVSGLVSLDLWNKSTNSRLEYWTPSNNLGNNINANYGHGFYPKNVKTPVQAWDSNMDPGHTAELIIRGRW